MGSFKVMLFLSHALAHVNGTTVLHMQKDAVQEFRFPLPPESVIVRFSRQLAALDSRASDNVSDSHVLSDLRTALLPRLLSGEVPIRKVGRSPTGEA